MIKKMKKISYIFMLLFLIAVVFILIAIKFNWGINSAFIPIFIILLLSTMLCMLIVSISAMVKTMRKYGKKDFFKAFVIKLIFFFVAVYAAAFLKKDINILIILGSSLALSIFSYYYSAE